MENSFTELLANFKKNDDIEFVIPLMGDTRLQNGAVAWKSVKITYNPQMGICTASNPNEQWEWLWSQISYDVNSFGVYAGLKPQEAGPVLLRLIGLHLVYPDGEINQYAKMYLHGVFRSQVSKYMPAKNAKK